MVNICRPRVLRSKDSSARDGNFRRAAVDHIWPPEGPSNDVAGGCVFVERWACSAVDIDKIAA